jgi:hypothetical protein
MCHFWSEPFQFFGGLNDWIFLLFNTHAKTKKADKTKQINKMFFRVNFMTQNYKKPKGNMVKPKKL